MTEEQAEHIIDVLMYMYSDNMPDVTIEHNANSDTYFLRLRLLPGEDYYLAITQAFDGHTSDYFPKQ